MPYARRDQISGNDHRPQRAGRYRVEADAAGGVHAAKQHLPERLEARVAPQEVDPRTGKEVRDGGIGVKAGKVASMYGAEVAYAAQPMVDSVDELGAAAVEAEGRRVQVV